MYQQYNNYYHSDFYSMPNNNNGVGIYYGGEDELGSSATTSSVDCTLSLGTPSTRSMDGNAKEKKKKKQSSYLSSFWNMVPSRNTTTTSTPPQMAAAKGHRGGSNGGDTMFARRCANCDTTTTPLWRNGPRGPKSLCNACGIRYKKEQRRAAAGEGGQSQRLSCYSSSEYRFVDDEDRRPDADSGVIPFLSWRFNVTDRPSFIHDFTS